jgi:Ku70/Ku80 beta-barrel domain
VRVDIAPFGAGPKALYATDPLRQQTLYATDLYRQTPLRDSPSTRREKNKVKTALAGLRNVTPAVALSHVMAPRAYWKGYLKLSLVSCPIALYPATSEREKTSFHQINKKTGHRIKYVKVDAESGEEVEAAAIVKGYQVGKGEYIELEPEELEAVAIESKRVIDIDEFVPRNEIDEIYLNNPY